MINFRKDSGRTIGKAECAGLVSIDEDLVVDVSSRQCDKPYFAIKVSFRQSVEMVPTGDASVPEAPSSDELIITDSEFDWHFARHKNSDELAAADADVDSNVYVREELPERVAKLTLGDRDHMLEKIKVYCENLYSKMDGDADIGEGGQGLIS